MFDKYAIGSNGSNVVVVVVTFCASEKKTKII